MRRLSLPLILTVILSLLLPAVASAGPPGHGGPPHHGTDGRPLTVVTYNIHHAQGADGVLDLERVAVALRDSGASVITLQEVDRHFGDRSENVDQASWLGRRLGMQVVFGANLDLAPAAAGDPRRQYGTAILSKYPIRSWQNTLLPKLPAGEQRGLLEADIAVRGTTVRILTTHLQHNNTPERLAQIAAIRDLTADDHRPTVLTGDMNALPDSVEYARLSDSFSDIWPLVGEGDGFTFDSDAPQGRIDYVFTANGVRARAATVLQTLASDHLPVRAELRVPDRHGR